MKEFLTAIVRNPLTRYMRYLMDLIVLSARYEHLRLGYMSHVSHSILNPYVRLGSNVLIMHSRIGSYSYIGEGTRISRAIMGRFCSIAPGCRIGLPAHPTRSFVSTHPAFRDVGHLQYSFVDRTIFDPYGRVDIGSDVWIGENALVLDGVTIGNGAIVGAGAVVVKSVPDFAVVGGVPARLIRYRFTPPEINWLNTLCWWDKDETWLRQHSGAFLNIDDLMRACRYVPEESNTECSREAEILEEGHS